MVGLEILNLTKILPNMDNFSNYDSLKDNFNENKYKYVISNIDFNYDQEISNIELKEKSN